MKLKFKIIIITGCIIAAPVILFLIFLGIAQLAEYRPSPAEILADIGNTDISIKTGAGTELAVLSLNTGYCGLDQSMDFIMEGGKMGRPGNKVNVEKNLQGLISLTRRFKPDIIFLQEVDERADRSFGINQISAWHNAYPDASVFFGINFNVFFVPFPLTGMIGMVKSGILTISNLPVISATRYQLPGEYPWPVRMFNLKRCVIVHRIKSPVEGREWYLLNIHLDAYDPTGNLRREQLNFIKTMILELYGQGHYVLVGGDWNSIFPGLGKDTFTPYTTPEENLFWVHPVPPDWTPPEWQWAFDPDTPTCRSLEKPYQHGENFETIIDGFLVSPNLEITSMAAENDSFTFTDHNPVFIRVKIKE